MQVLKIMPKTPKFLDKKKQKQVTLLPSFK